MYAEAVPGAERRQSPQVGPYDSVVDPWARVVERAVPVGAKPHPAEAGRFHAFPDCPIGGRPLI